MVPRSPSVLFPAGSNLILAHWYAGGFYPRGVYRHSRRRKDAALLPYYGMGYKIWGPQRKPTQCLRWGERRYKSSR